jgi:hypothetical protein
MDVLHYAQWMYFNGCTSLCPMDVLHYVAQWMYFIMLPNGCTSLCCLFAGNGECLMIRLLLPMYSTSSGSADGPKTPSLHEEDGPANSKAEEREKLEAARAETEALRLQLDNKIEELKRENVRLIEELARVNDELAVVQAQVSEVQPPPDSCCRPFKEDGFHSSSVDLSCHPGPKLPDSTLSERGCQKIYQPSRTWLPQQLEEKWNFWDCLQKWHFDMTFFALVYLR